MSRYFITHQTLQYSCGEVLVTMTTNNLQHLWLLSTTQLPLIIPRRDRRLNNTVPHQNNHNVVIERVTEQDEPGRTLTHTFRLPWPHPSPVLFFYAINLGEAGIKATRTAIYAYELTYTALAAETWSSNGYPDLPWDYNPSPPTSPPSFRPGSATLYGNLAYTPLLSLNLTPYFGTTPNSFCDQQISIKLGGFLGYGSPPQFEIGLTLEFRNALNQTMSRTIYYDSPVTPCQFNYNNLVGLTFPGAIATFNLQEAYDNTTGLCRTAMDPQIPDAFPWRLSIYYAVSWPNETTEIWNATIGSVILTTTDGAPRDISKVWRARRLAPIIS